jgi:adenylate cyclase class 2
MVTFKMKEVRDGVEINREREFRLQDGEDGAAALEEMLGLFGLEPRSCKRKRGSAWDCGGVTAELHEVEGLGHFLELEILAEDGGVETVRQARAKLLDLLARCGIDRAKIESRYYTELLEAKQGEDDHE